MAQHEAYIAYPPATIPVQIESITGFDNNVLLGTRQGHLLMYSVAQHPTETKMDLQLLQYDKNFSKKPIVQIQVIPEYQLLFSLSDGVINVNDISRHNFPIVHTATRTKGASIFAMDISRSKSLTGEAVLVVRLCVAIKRKLQFWYWKHDKLLEFNEDIELTDYPKTIVWSGNTVCIGYKTDYVMYDISKKTPEKRELFPTSSSKAVDPCISLVGNDLFAFTKDEFLIAVDPKNKTETNFSGMSETRDTSGRFFKSLSWSQPLQVLVWDEPYAVGLIQNSLEIRVPYNSGTNKDSLIQNIPDFNKARFLIYGKKGLLFAASLTQLWCIQMVDIPKQRKNLLKQKKFHLALQLTNISDESEYDKQEQIQEIQTLYAYDLFANKMYAESMKEFSKLKTDPCEVIRLFPDLLPQDSYKKNKENDVPTSSKQFTERDLENGLLALIEFLTEVRFNIKKDLQNAVVTMPYGKDVNPLLSIIDTTLLKCYLQTNDSFVAPLLRLNHCHLEESEKTLKQYKKYGELIILYQTKGQHKKALQLLQTQAMIPNISLSGHDRTIQYLHQLGSEHKHLIFEFSGWILEKHPEDGLKIFTEDIPEVESLPRAEVLDFLLKNHKKLVIPYLEHLIDVWNEQKSIFHNILIKQYLDQIKSKKPTSPTSDSVASLDYKQYREKLKKFLRESDRYTLESVVTEFPCTDLFEERAIVLGKLGKHEKVLAIYIQILGNVEKSIEYCDELYEKNSDDPVVETAYLSLVRILLTPPKTPPYPDVPLHALCLTPQKDTVLELLEKYATRVDPHAILQILPGDIPIWRLSKFMELALQNQLARRRRTQMLKGLLYSQNLQLQEQRRHYESKCVSITEFTVCPVCKKKFVNQSAFVIRPNGDIVHFSCSERN